MIAAATEFFKPPDPQKELRQTARKLQKDVQTLEKKRADLDRRELQIEAQMRNAYAAGGSGVQSTLNNYARGIRLLRAQKRKLNSAKGLIESAQLKIESMETTVVVCTALGEASDKVRQVASVVDFARMDGMIRGYTEQMGDLADVEETIRETMDETFEEAEENEEDEDYDEESSADTVQRIIDEVCLERTEHMSTGIPMYAGGGGPMHQRTPDSMYAAGGAQPMRLQLRPVVPSRPPPPPAGSDPKPDAPPPYIPRSADSEWADEDDERMRSLQQQRDDPLQRRLRRFPPPTGGYV